MKKSTWVWVVVIILIIIGIWYFSSIKKTTEAPVTTAASSSQVESTSSPSGVKPNIAAPGTVPLVSISAGGTLGKHLVAVNGMTLYTYKNDTKGVSNCTGDCAKQWPAYTRPSTDALVAGAGVTGDFTSIGRTDGSRQMTYNGMPLYYYKGDVKADDTNGQNVGGVWFVAKP